MRRDVTTELKELRLYGMVSAWTDLTAQGDTTTALRIPLMADSDSTFIADSIPCDGGRPALVS